MIQTSRNASTFCDTFPHQVRGCVLSKLDGIRGTHCGESGSECACRRKACPLCILQASDSRSTHIGQAPTAPLRRASISEGKGLTGLLQYSCNLWHSSAQAEEGDQICLVSFHWLTGPQRGGSGFLEPWCRTRAYEEREPGHSENTMGPRPIPGHRRVWPKQAYQGSETPEIRSKARTCHANSAT